MKNQEQWVPQLSKAIGFHKLSKTRYFIHQKEYDYRIEITPAVYELLRQVDGIRSLKELREGMNNPPSIVFLFELLHEKLGEYGIIETDRIAIRPRKKPSYLKLSFILISPEIISKITPRLKFLFRPRVMAVVISVCFSLIFSSILYHYSVLAQQRILGEDWALFLALGFVSVTFHEFGHVTAAAFYGASHGGIGGGFYLFTPVYFADVTDIWKLKPKQRIVVNLAGIYFELMACSLFMLIGLISQEKALIILATLVFLKTLLNLNPFLRSDGYWIVTDAMGISSLHKVSVEQLLKLLQCIRKRKKGFRFSLKSALLVSYALLNYLILLSFLGYTLIFNANSILYFPFNLYNFFQSLINGTQFLTLHSLLKFIIPIFFYYLVFRFVVQEVIGKNSRKTAPDKK